MNNFFDDPKEQSLVKSTIVAKYFGAWANVMKHQKIDRIAYIDLFAGPGHYQDGTRSTPIIVLEQAIQDSILAQKLVSIFNDIDPDNVESLERSIRALPGIDGLRYPPRVYNYEVGTQIVESFEQKRLVPTLLFVDPWGYKGLSLRLVNSVLKNWGCDCIFFFNYNRVNMGLNNPIVTEHMNALFGDEKAEHLRWQLSSLSPEARENRIVEELSQSLKGEANRYVLPFRFKNDNGTRASHHLIFVSKNFLGYEIMKDIMAKESSKSNQGVATFEYNPADKTTPLLFELSRPLDELAQTLTTKFAGRTMTRTEMYDLHNVGTPFTKSNYLKALQQLESEGRIIVERPSTLKQKHAFSDQVKVTFPR